MLKKVESNFHQQNAIPNENGMLMSIKRI